MNHRILIVNILAFGIAAPAAAQSHIAGAREHHVFTHAVVESKITTGRPYAAEATTEFVQVLGDGNKIARKTSVRIYRDGEGRTRREELGPDGTPRSISIYDPVTHVSYVLNPATRTAHKSAVRVVAPEGFADRVSAERTAAGRVAGKISLVAPAAVPGHPTSEGGHKRQAEVAAHAAVHGALRPPTVGSTVVYPTDAPDAESEPLGQKTIDGLAVDGTRSTTVIPAEAIGNQQPITVVSERWFSPDLDIIVMTKHNDPRTGETTYSLSNIVPGEPSAGLFDVPSDYTIAESR